MAEVFPPGFSELEPFADWALPTERARYAKRLASTMDELQAFYDESPNGMVLAPLPDLGKRITLTAWTKLATCEQFDEDAFAAFRGTYRGKGPERVPVGILRPGT